MVYFSSQGTQIHFLSLESGSDFSDGSVKQIRQKISSHSNVGSIMSRKSCIILTPGHQQLVIDVRFSPDGRLIASASFDKSVKLWEGKTGKLVNTCIL